MTMWLQEKPVKSCSGFSYLGTEDVIGGDWLLNKKYLRKTDFCLLESLIFEDKFRMLKCTIMQDGGSMVVVATLYTDSSAHACILFIGLIIWYVINRIPNHEHDGDIASTILLMDQ